MRFVRLLFLLLAFAAQPATAQWSRALSPELQSLQQRLASTAAENPGEYGIAAMDLTTGEIVTVNGDTPFPMASTVKVAVAATSATSAIPRPRSRC